MADSSWYHSGASYRNHQTAQNQKQEHNDDLSKGNRFNKAENCFGSYPNLPSIGGQPYGTQPDVSSVAERQPPNASYRSYNPSSSTYPPPPGNYMGFDGPINSNRACPSMNVQTDLQSTTLPQPPTVPIKILGKNYFCELCNIKFPVDQSSLLVHCNGKVHEIELLKKLDVLTIKDRQCYCTKCNVSLGFRFQVAVMHYEKGHKGIFKKMVELKQLAPVVGDITVGNNGQGRGRGGGRGRGRGRGRGAMAPCAAPSKVAIVNSASMESQKGLPKGFKIMNNTYYCEICAMPLPIDVDMMQHCFGRNHEIKLLIAEGVLTLKDNKCSCELCKKELGFGFKAALKHIREHHKDEYKKIQSSKELGSVQKFQDTSDKSLQPPMKKSKISPGEQSGVSVSSDKTVSAVRKSRWSDSADNGDKTVSAVRKSRWSDSADNGPSGLISSTDCKEKSIKQEDGRSEDVFIKQECETSTDIFSKEEHESSLKRDHDGNMKEHPETFSSKPSSRDSSHTSSNYSKNSHRSSLAESSKSSSRSDYSISSTSTKSGDTQDSRNQSSGDHKKFSGKSEKDKSCYGMYY